MRERLSATRVCAKSLSVVIGTLVAEKAMNRIGASAGFTLRSVGGLGSAEGSWRVVCAMAFCTSCVALSMSRSSAKDRLICVEPVPLWEVITSRPGICVKARSSGVATVAAIVSGSAPGRLALTLMVGKSTLGSSATGRRV